MSKDHSSRSYSVIYISIFSVEQLQNSSRYSVTTVRLKSSEIILINVFLYIEDLLEDTFMLFINFYLSSLFCELWNIAIQKTISFSCLNIHYLNISSLMTLIPTIPLFTLLFISWYKSLAFLISGNCFKSQDRQFMTELGHCLSCII